MFVRVSTARRNGNTYRYAQLVESHRGDDGRPRHRVVANLGRITDERQLENLQRAFRATRDGCSVTITHEAAEATATTRERPAATLSYLDVAVLLELFKELRLDKTVRGAVGTCEMDVPVEKVVAALVIQRCVAPDSKLEATRWFPTTALPELLAIAPEQFNNTRLHRVLELLEHGTDQVMRLLSRGCAERAKPRGFTTLYLDITDTWFVGAGPELASVSKTKEGLRRKKVGIVLLCNERGYPLRWRVLEGRYAEGPVMLDMMRETSEQTWTNAAPVVCDRAMGHSAFLREMHRTGLPFLTALSSTEMETYCSELERFSKALVHLHADSETVLADTADEAGKVMTDAGMKRIDETRFVLDIGLVTAPADQGEMPQDAPDHDVVAEGIRTARRATEQVANGAYRSYADAARAMNMAPGWIKRCRRLLRLPQDLQERLLNGEATGHGVQAFTNLATMSDEDEQRAAFDRLLARSRFGTLSTTPTTPREADETSRLLLRCVLCFNPQVFAEQRLGAARLLRSIDAEIASLNQRLASPRSAMKRRGIERRVDELLRRHNLISCFEVHLEQVEVNACTRYQVRLHLDQQQWRKRRRTDGFSVLVADKKVVASAAELTRMYRAKDAVEADFRVIKSVLQLRPVRHRTDAKVRAHVTLCMLALLVERTLLDRLPRRPQPVSADRALALLEQGRLCHFPSPKARDAYLLTTPTKDQRKILRRLGLERLADDGELAVALTPRSVFVTTTEDETA